jgi:uncharacterized protein (TIRG00374 family)
MKRSQQLFVLFGLIISVVFLWLAFRGLQPEKVLESLGQVNLLLLLASAAVFLLSMITITMRWQLLLNASKRVGLGRLYDLVNVGYMGNNVYPFRSGEVLRIVLLNRDEHIPLARITTTVLVERVFDGVVMLMFVIVPLMFVDIASPETRAAAAVAAPIFLIALAVFLLLASQPRLFTRLSDLIAARLPGKLGRLVTALTGEVIGGLGGLRSIGGVLSVFLMTTLSWGIQGIVYWMVGLAFGLDVGIPIMIVVVGVVNLAGLIPASPGQIGVFEFFASRVLMGVGVAEETALAFAFLVHLVVWLPPTIHGFVVLVRRGLGFAAIRRARELEAGTDSRQG